MHGSLTRLALEKPHSVQRQIYNHLREVIVSGEMAAGARIPSAEQLATAWDTSTTTVHQALFRLLKEGLLVRTPRNGTFVRQRQAKLTCVGIYNSAAVLGESLFSQTLQAALKEELAQAEIEMDVWLDPRPENEVGEPWMPLVKAAEHREFQALIVLSTDLSLLRWQQQLPVPTAFQCLGDGANFVYADLPQFIEASLQALAEQGCHSVGLILPGDPGYLEPSEQRSLWSVFMEQFLEVAQQQGLAVKNEWMRLVRIRPGVPILPQEQFGYEQFLQLWQQPARPDGLVAFPDTVARGAIAAMLEKQVRVPAELKLALHKNEAVHLLCPMPATLLVSSERAMARALIEQVQKQFRGEPCAGISVPFAVRSSGGRAS